MRSVYVNDTPVLAADGTTNFTGVTFDFRSGTNDQDVISGFSDTENEVSVNVRLQAQSPIVRAFSGDIDAVRVTLCVPQLTSQDKTTGDLHGSTVSVQIDVENNGGGYAPFTTTVFSGKTTSRYKRSIYIPLSGSGPWNVRITRLTEDSTSSSLINQTWWDSVAEIVESKLSYPNSAIVGLSVDAEQFADIPTRAYHIKGILCQVPSNYDPVSRTYSGLWDGTFKQVWTNNPAWVYYDIITSGRYGLGDYIDASGIDKWALYEIAQYCDGMVPSGFGYLEPRFTCNLYIQTREDAYKVLLNLTSVFRGMAFWSAGQVTAICDKPTDAVSIFTNANVIDGVFSYAGSSRAARHTVALVTWNDPDDMYRQKVEYVEDVEGIIKYGVNQTEVVAYGCTSRGQAHRYGKWILYTERLESEVISWKTGLEGTSVYPGAIVKVADNLRSGDRIGGRSLDATTDTITLDAPVTLIKNTVYTLSVVLPEGGVSDHTVTTTEGTTSVLHVTPSFTTIPQIHSMWVLASVNLNPQTFRVLSVKESGKTQVEITALQHDPNKFAMIEYDAKFASPVISSLKGAPDTPQNLKASDTLFDQGPGIVGIKLHFSWEGKATRFDVRWKQGDDNAKVFSTTTNYADISPVSPGITTLQVRGVDVLGRVSKWATLNYDTLGKMALPADVTGFTAVADLTGVDLKWNASTEIDVNRYELRLGSEWDTAEVIAEVYATALRVALSGTTATYLIKAVDTSDNRSANAASATVSVGAPATPTLTAVGGLFSIKFDWSFGDSRQDILGTELWWSPSVNNRASAVRLTFEPFPSSTYTQIGLDSGSGGYYWIRVSDIFKNMSAWYPESAHGGLYATSSTDPSSLLTQLQGALGMPQLAAELAEPIGRLPDINLSDLNLAIDSLFQSVASDAAAGEALKASSAIKTETINRDTAIKAETTARETLSAKVSNDIVAAIQTERTVTASALGAEASARETLASKVGANTAAIQTESSTRASADSALSSKIDTVQAALGNNIATVQQKSEASASAINGLYAKWSVKTQVMADGQYAVAGVELLSGVPGQSVFAVLADRFLVYQPNGIGTPKQVLTMGTVNGVTAMGFDGSAIFDGSITARQINGTGLKITGEVNVGGYTGYSWPPAGQTGAHLSAQGLLAGNANGGGKYFQIYTPAGDWANAQINTNIPAHLEDAQVSTLKLAGASVTVPSYVSGGNNIWINNYNISSNETATYSVFLLCSMVCGDPADLQCRLYGGGHNGTLIINELPGEAQLATRGIVIQLQSNTNYSFNWYDAWAGTYVGGGSMFILATKR